MPTSAANAPPDAALDLTNRENVVTTKRAMIMDPRAVASLPHANTSASSTGAVLVRVVAFG